MYHPLYFLCLKYFITGCLQRESVRPGYIFLPLMSGLRAGVERNCLSLLRESHCFCVPSAGILPSPMAFLNIPGTSLGLSLEDVSVSQQVLVKLLAGL